MSLQEIDDVIGKPENSWHEFDLEILAERLEDLSDDDWKSLVAQFKVKPLYWRIRCAEGLDELGDYRSLEMLASLLLSGEKDVAITSVCALEDAEHPLGKEYIKPLENLLSKMDSKAETRYEDVERLLQSLENQ